MKLSEIRKAVVAGVLAVAGAYQTAQPHTAQEWVGVVMVGVVAAFGTWYIPNGDVKKDPTP